ncbi:MAG: GldG family protein [Planctomycetota bacterium]|nr:GldG family protein [Planctomycetota bacterium]MDG2142698.1 GldG family protein [Planctomycetota bacterium]
MSQAPMRRRSQRLNATLSILLLALAVVLVNDAARRHVSFKRDLSEDQLYAASPELERRLSQLDDVLVVRAFFTASPEQGKVQIAKSQLVSQLRDYEDMSGGRIRLEFVDPSTSSEAKLEAIRLGISPVQVPGRAGSGSRPQDVWLGVSLKYRGSERSLPMVMPLTLEYAFASELFRLMRGHTPKIGWFGPKVSATPEPGQATFQNARRALQLAGELVDMGSLATFEGVPEDIDLLMVVRPQGLHPRAAFAIDQYLQSGGRAIFALDNHIYPLDQTTEATHRVTGLEMLLAAWGVPLSSGIAWDPKCLSIGITQSVPAADGTSTKVRTDVDYTFWPDIGPEGFSEAVPVTARLGGLILYWAQAIIPGDLPETAERVDLVKSSEGSFIVDAPALWVLDPSLTRSQSIELNAAADSSSFAMASSVTGKLPSPFVEGGQYPGAPTPLEFFDAEMGVSTWDGSVTDEDVVSLGKDTHVIVIGDSDWLRDGQSGYFFDPDPRGLGSYSASFLGNIVDWMLLEEDLVALRSRTAIERPLTNFLEEERMERELTELSTSVNFDEAEMRTKAEDEAEAAASMRRASVMAAATGGSLLAALLLVGLPGLLRSRKRSLFEVPEGETPSKEVL